MTRSIVKKFRDLIREYSNQHVRSWKADGKPVVGYFCHYMPPELVLAAGALPLRMRGAGSDDTSQADALMSGRVCTYVRHVVNLALEGHYDFLDGEISLNTCDWSSSANSRTSLPVIMHRITNSDSMRAKNVHAC